MGLMDKARQTAEQARAGMLGERPAPAPPPADQGDADPDAVPPAPPPPPSSARAGAAVSAFIERINPGLLADLIIHATSAQERTNKALKEKGSQYRISEMYLTASIPPQVGFYIARLGDIDSDAGTGPGSAPALAAGEPAPAPPPANKAPATTKKKAAAPAAKKSAPRPAGP